MTRHVYNGHGEMIAVPFAGSEPNICFCGDVDHPHTADGTRLTATQAMSLAQPGQNVSVITEDCAYLLRVKSVARTDDGHISVAFEPRFDVPEIPTT